MVQFIVKTQPELKGTVVLQTQESLKRELDTRSSISKSLLELLEVYDPEHDFVAGIMCDGEIVSLNLISQTGSIGFTETNATKFERVSAEPSNFLN